MSTLHVIGDPVVHSKSPIIHGAMLAELGVDVRYTAHPVPRGGLEDYLVWAEGQDVIGFNATMPHKEDLLPLLDELDGDAAMYGAVNTVCLQGGRRIGHNTDGQGCLAALEEGEMWPAEQVVVLGAGGAARAVALKLAREGARRVWVCNRTLPRAAELCAQNSAGALTPAGFDVETLAKLCGQAQLLVNCTNLGMEGCPRDFDDLSFLDALPTGAGVFDLIYHPAQTSLLVEARRRGLNTLGGLSMLINQAILALEFFLDCPLDRVRMAQVAGQALKRALD